MPPSPFRDALLRAFERAVAAGDPYAGFRELEAFDGKRAYVGKWFTTRGHRRATAVLAEAVIPDPPSPQRARRTRGEPDIGT